jgi:autotransporter translocation and assembly factor TamB
MSMNSTDLALGKLRLDSIAASASYADDVLTLDDCQLKASGSNATLRGSIPFRVSLYEAQARPRAADMQMQLNAELTNADVLPLLFPFIGRAAGSGEVHLSIGGRLDDPRYYNGAPGRPAIALRGLRLDVPANDVEFSGVEAALTAAGDHFEIDRLYGVVNRGDFAVTQGTVGLTRGIPTDVDVAITADDVTLTKRRLYRAMGDAAVRMHGPLDRVQVDGDVTFSSLDYKRDWAELARESLRSKALIALREGARFQYPILRGMVVNLRVQANEVAFDTGAGTITADIDGGVVGPLAELIFHGDVRRLGGEFEYRKRRFEIESGYAENPSRTRFNPQYEITATSAETLKGVFVVDTQGNRRQRDANVRISVSGTLDRWPAPQIDVTVLNQGPGEDYAMAPAESLALLTWGDASPEASGDRVGEAMYSELIDRMGAQVAPHLGFSELQFEVDPQAPEETRIEFTKELSNRVAFTYGSTFQLGQEQRLEIDYQLDRHVGISGERNEEGKFGVDLKLEYDFR